MTDTNETVLNLPGRYEAEAMRTRWIVLQQKRASQGGLTRMEGRELDELDEMMAEQSRVAA